MRLLRAGALDLEATEMALREGMHQVGSRILEKLLEVDQSRSWIHRRWIAGKAIRRAGWAGARSS